MVDMYGLTKEDLEELEMADPAVPDSMLATAAPTVAESTVPDPTTGAEKDTALADFGQGALGFIGGLLGNAPLTRPVMQAARSGLMASRQGEERPEGHSFGGWEAFMGVPQGFGYNQGGGGAAAGGAAAGRAMGAAASRRGAAKEPPLTTPGGLGTGQRQLSLLDSHLSMDPYLQSLLQRGMLNLEK